MAGKHGTIQPPVQDTATEIVGLLTRQQAQQKQLSTKSKQVRTLLHNPHPPVREVQGCYTGGVTGTEAAAVICWPYQPNSIDQEPYRTNVDVEEGG
eukprot:1017291-Pelagomonas_calceolata.AAC.1